jgi:hypothetical protein
MIAPEGADADNGYRGDFRGRQIILLGLKALSIQHSAFSHDRFLASILQARPWLSAEC